MVWGSPPWELGWGWRTLPQLADLEFRYPGFWGWALWDAGGGMWEPGVKQARISSCPADPPQARRPGLF